MNAPRLIDGPNKRVLILCDHASNAIPAGIQLGVPDAAMQDHVAWDIGAEAVTKLVAAELGCRAWLASVSRLVIDVNRTPETAIPPESDGVPIPGNQNLDEAATQERMAIHHDFHDGISALITEHRPDLVVSVHSFTPQLKAAPAPRPWPIAILWNQDEATAKLGLAALAKENLPGPIGANEPYSGKVLNYTMDRHAENLGIPALGFEIRQDLISDADGIKAYAGIVARTIRSTLEAL